MVAIAAVWIAIDALGDDELKTDSPVAAPTDDEPSEEPEESPTQPVETTAPPPPPPPPPSAEPTETEVPLITDGVSVQVLNATSDPTADEAMADKLARLGYQVVSVEGASKAYELTTVFWSTPESQAAAEALAARFEWVAQEKPANLSDSVSFHVVIGNDEL